MKMKSKTFADPYGLLIYRIIYHKPDPVPKELKNYIGLSENEILQKFPYSNLERKREGDEIYLQIRLSNATLTCIFDDNKICKKGLLFPD